MTVTVSYTHLNIINNCLAEEMDQADDELRETIRMIWPFQAKKMLDLLIPRGDRLNKMNLTVGKIYAGLLILESWRNTRFGQIDSGIPVSNATLLSISHRYKPARISFLASVFSFFFTFNSSGISKSFFYIISKRFYAFIFPLKINIISLSSWAREM